VKALAATRRPKLACKGMAKMKKRRKRGGHIELERKKARESNVSSNWLLEDFNPKKMDKRQ